MKKIAILCITDPKTHPPFDTTVELYRQLTLDDRFELFHTHPALITSSLEHRAVRVSGIANFEAFLQLDNCTTEIRDAKSYHLIFHRADKPFPPCYLDHLCSWNVETRMVNSPRGLKKVDRREFFDEHLSQFMPARIFTRDVGQAKNFLLEHGKVVAKKNISYGGKGVYCLTVQGNSYTLENSSEKRSQFSSIETLLAALFEQDPEPFEFVRFLKNVFQGDKRILVIEGKILGAYVRKSSSQGWINNITHGGTCAPCEISPKEEQVVARTFERYQSLGVSTLGYDFLVDDDGSWILSEINAGNIGGYGRLLSLYGKDGFKILLDWLAMKAQRSFPA